MGCERNVFDNQFDLNIRFEENDALSVRYYLLTVFHRNLSFRDQLHLLMTDNRRKRIRRIWTFQTLINYAFRKDRENFARYPK